MWVAEHSSGQESTREQFLSELSWDGPGKWSGVAGPTAITWAWVHEKLQLLLCESLRGNAAGKSVGPSKGFPNLSSWAPENRGPVEIHTWSSGCEPEMGCVGVACHGNRDSREKASSPREGEDRCKPVLRAYCIPNTMQGDIPPHPFYSFRNPVSSPSPSSTPSY